MNLFEELKRRNVLRVAVAYVAGSWLLIQVLETLFPIFGLAETSIRIVVVVLGVLFVPALVVAWAFELTPEGLKLDSEIAAEAPSRPRTHKLLDRVIMVTLALAVGYFAFDKFVLDPAEDVEIAAEAEERGRSEALLSSYGEKSIAVLAFDDLSPESDQEYFSDGIAEELLNLLARIPALRVAGRTSAFSFKGSTATIADIGEQLNVAHVLEGSVRKFGDKIRITAQLIEANTDTHIWSETYDREMGDIFAIQDEIAAQVVEELKMTLLGPAPRAKEVNPEAYALILQAGYLLDHGSDEQLSRIVPLLEQALEIDPDYAQAWELLAWSYYFGVGGEMPEEESTRLYNEALDRAVNLEPENPGIQASQAWRLMRRGDYVCAGKLVEKAVASEPTDQNIASVAIWFTRYVGRPDLAIQLGEFILARDPLCEECQRTLANAYRNAGRYEDALALMSRIDAFWGIEPFYVGYVQLLNGEPEAALKSAQANENITQLIPMALHDVGRTEEALEMLKSMEEQGELPLQYLAEAYAWIGDADRAFELWEKAVRAMDVSDGEPARQIEVTIQATNLVFAKLHDDPRWQRFIDKYGIPPEQREAIDIEFNLPKYDDE